MINAFVAVASVAVRPSIVGCPERLPSTQMALVKLYVVPLKETVQPPEALGAGVESSDLLQPKAAAMRKR